MKTRNLTVVAAVLLGSLSLAAVQDATWKVDNAHSAVTFSVRHFFTPVKGQFDQFEAQVVYDPAKVTYAQLLDAFWRNIDPTQANGQFCDHGSQYRSEIFYHDDIQRKAAEASKAALLKNKPFAGDVHTLITRAAEFYPAEDYHQDYYRKNPIRYTYYKTSCGREARLKEVWKTR
jgi:methionine-S-sulfoxide reductase